MCVFYSVYVLHCALYMRPPIYTVIHTHIQHTIYTHTHTDTRPACVSCVCVRGSLDHFLVSVLSLPAKVTALSPALYPLALLLVILSAHSALRRRRAPRPRGAQAAQPRSLFLHVLLIYYRTPLYIVLCTLPGTPGDRLAPVSPSRDPARSARPDGRGGGGRTA